MNSKLLVLVTTFVSLLGALAIGFSGVSQAYAGAAGTAETQEGAAKGDLRRYEQVLLLPAELNSEEEAEFEGVPAPARLAMAAHLTRSVADVLTEKGLLAEKPEPGVAVLQLVLNVLEMTPKGDFAAPPAPPFPMPRGLPPTGSAKSSSAGRASVTAKLTDSRTGETLASFEIQKTAKGNVLDALPKAIDKVAQAIGDRLE